MKLAHNKVEVTNANKGKGRVRKDENDAEAPEIRWAIRPLPISTRSHRTIRFSERRNSPGGEK
jgi:hypothetical protein